MASFSAKKLNPSEINKGNEYTKDSRVSIEVLNGLVNSALYSQAIVDNIQNLGNYSSTRTYKMLNVVMYNGSCYIAIEDNFSNKLPTNTSYWKLIAEKGDKGDDKTPNIRIGKVTSSSTPSVTNSGTSTSVVLDFAIPTAGVSTNNSQSVLDLYYYTDGNYNTRSITLYFDTNTYSYSSNNSYKIMSCDLTNTIKDYNIFQYGTVSISMYDLVGKDVVPLLTNIKDSSGNGAINAFSVAYVKEWGQVNISATTSSSKKYGFRLLLFVKD